MAPLPHHPNMLTTTTPTTSKKQEKTSHLLPVQPGQQLHVSRLVTNLQNLLSSKSYGYRKYLINKTTFYLNYICLHCSLHDIQALGTQTVQHPVGMGHGGAGPPNLSQREEGDLHLSHPFCTLTGSDHSGWVLSLWLGMFTMAGSDHYI